MAKVGPAMGGPTGLVPLAMMYDGGIQNHQSKIPISIPCWKYSWPRVIKAKRQHDMAVISRCLGGASLLTALFISIYYII